MKPDATRKPGQNQKHAFSWFLWFLLLSLGISIGLMARTPPGLLLLLFIPSAVLIIDQPPIGLALFLTAGGFKASSLLAPLSSRIDLTLFFAFLVLIIIIKNIRTTPDSSTLNIPKAFVLVFIFNILLITGLLYTPDLANGLDKAARFLTLSTLATFAPFYILRRVKDWRLFFLSLLLIGLTLASFSLINITIEQTAAAQAVDAGHIGLGRLSGMAALIAASLVVFSSIRHQRIFGVFVFIATATAVFFSSARGPFVALVIALPMLFLFIRKRQSLWRRVLLLSIAFPLLSWGLVAFGLVPSIFKERLQSIFAVLVGGFADGSVTNRLELFGRALAAIRSSPLFGIGTGGFPSVAWDLPANHYPHNIFLEIGAELGVVALIVFSLLIALAIFALRDSVKKAADHNHLLITGTTTVLLTFWLTNALFSGDLNSNRLLWATIGLAFAIPAIGQTTDKSTLVKRICVITSVHQPFDTRIFHREIKTLKNHGYDVTFIAPLDSNETIDGVSVVSIRKSKTRSARMIRSLGLWRLAQNVNADLYHFHDPELLPAMVVLRLLTQKPIIYDVHEDYVASAMDRHWLPVGIRRLIGFCFHVIEAVCVRFCQGIIYVSPPIRNRYRKFKGPLVQVSNYPLKTTFAKKLKTTTKTTIVHIGGLVEAKGLLQLIEALAIVNSTHPGTSLDLIGPCTPLEFADKMAAVIKELGLERNVKVKQAIPYQEVRQALSQGQIGVIPFLPYPNHLIALPNKLFQYMATGTPIVASDFPLMRSIINEARCGLLVDPTRPEEIARAIKYLLDHRDEAKAMGQRGHQAFLEKYNWETTSIGLIDLYENLLNNNPIGQSAVPVGAKIDTDRPPSF